MKKRVVVISIVIFGLFLIVAVGTLVGIAMIFSERTDNNFSMSDNKIAVIELSGEIVESDKYIDLIKKNTENSSIKAIILPINSPGGVVGASQEIYQEVTTARGQGKIIVSSMSDLGASGAYYVACGTNRIVANPGTLTGSIGVIMGFMNWQGLLGDKLGLKFYVIKSGKFKDTGSPDRPMRDDEKEYLQGVIDSVYLQFMNAVVDGRGDAIRELLAKKKMNLPELGQSTEKLKKMDLKQLKSQITYSELTAYIKPFAEGNIYTGEQASQTGFVDDLGNLDTAIKVAAKLAHIKGEPYIVHSKPKEPNLVDRMFGEASEVLSPIKRNGVSLEYVLR